MKKWRRVVLGDILRRSNEPAILDAESLYQELTVKIWGKGIISRGIVSGADIGSSRQFVRSGQLVLSKIDARNGAVGIVPECLDGAIVSKDFPSYDIDQEMILSGYLGWLVRSVRFVSICQAASEGTTNRVRLKEERLLLQEIGLPPLAEQRAIVTRLDTIADKARQVAARLDAIEADAERLLAARFHETIKEAQWKPMGEVAPVVRREVEIDLQEGYPELGIRSFGKGTFHKPQLSGADVGSKRLFRIEPGDLLFSNVFAWEGAIAVAGDFDRGRFGSHRFISCVSDPSKISAEFLCYYFLTPGGLERIREASPGGAGRNRTLGIEKLMAIPVPVPPLTNQHTFNTLQATVSAMKAKHAAIRKDLDALLPSMLERIFQSENC